MRGRFAAARVFRAVAAAVALAAFSAGAPTLVAQRSGASPASNGEGPAGAQAIPVRVDADRFFATLTTERGDALVLLLDTGDTSRIWETSSARLGLTVQTTSTPSGSVQTAALPSFQPRRGVPPPSINGGRVLITPPQDAFDTLMTRVTDGQLGADWFADRVWTFDYPGSRLWLHTQPLPPAPAGAHEVPVSFAVDASGRRIRHVPRIVAEIDGESWNMLFDTGATSWLPDAARAHVGDDGPVERPVSLIWQSIMDRWRARHPDWTYVDDSDTVSHAPMLRVPSVRIAGFDVGPVWFRSLPRALTNPPSPQAGVPITQSQVVGTIGGNVFGHFVITLDYPASVARFTRVR